MLLNSTQLVNVRGKEDYVFLRLPKNLNFKASASSHESVSFMLAVQIVEEVIIERKLM